VNYRDEFISDSETSPIAVTLLRNPRYKYTL